MNSVLQPWLSPEQPGWRQLLLFKAGWFGLVLQPVYSAAVVLLVLFWLMMQLKPAQRLTLFTLWGTGLLLDTLLLAGGVFQFDSVWLPFWLVLLWGWFSLFWLLVFSPFLQRSVAVALFGLLGGPLAYWGGAQLSNSLQIMAEAGFWLIMAPAWAALLLWARHAELWWWQRLKGGVDAQI